MRQKDTMMLMPTIARRKARFAPFGIIALLWLLATDRLSGVSAGPVSVSGLFTLATAGLALALVPMTLLVGTRIDGRKRVIRVGGRIPWPLTVFGLFALGRLALDPTVDGIQNVAVYVGFIAIAAVVSLKSSPQRVVKTSAWMRWAAVIATAIFLGSYAMGTDMTRERGFAIAALIFIAILVPYRGRNKVLRLAPYVVAVSAFLTLSRTAAVVGAALLVFTALRRRRRKTRKHIAVSIAMAAAVGFYWVFNYFEPFRDRFFGGDAGLKVGDMTINTSGRATLWQLTWESAAERPWMGHGPGAAQEMISSMYRNIDHPHNDYLRLLNDFGWLAASLFVVGAIMLAARILKRARRTDDPVHWSALIGLLAVGGMALTDNAIVYPFAMYPLAVLVGMSIGQPVPPKPRRIQQVRRSSQGQHQVNIRR